ncbi:septal ring lytic transglycosylase RlpA family protein [Neptunomonas qingdaonensis]|uniref:Endolytic peptidoglycan transglycosylase RlpA n=1 Tax=Neptunomonas qingdaonensis TaxID=1045558 RepID=A0A1I2NBW2_9GAMM|nr:septal ring lytic transglycosylase RlpA family protein [Neptunomonas qingdaonensis]SFG01063.1 rare lipoprotein A [Neptunomonas qingdaonensis]
MKLIVLSFSIFALLLSGCASKKSTSRYSIEHDHGPSGPVDVSNVPDAVPKVEPRSRGGNKSTYSVFGKQYSVLDDSDGYRERGGASWYGNKFHGHLTSNGETYDMYKMTAAHKSLPIPTYAKVTNLANGRQVIVRVNDRGPFHRGRIIDLSYAAASKLGVLRHGTAHVEVEAINPITWNASKMVAATEPQKNITPSATPAVLAPSVASNTLAAGRYLQVGAYSAEASARNVASQLGGDFMHVAHVNNIERASGRLYRVLLGPVTNQYEVDNMIEKLTQRGFLGAHLVNLP